ncbi:MAG: class I SAM-dependent methyltransferase [Gammaproteobacteria bacterium]|nr:class I SAM-dependent methyltransferase [Gammaproteobacteria bacterium]MDH5593521.1 class I SAM-dependent methyltransferase [Gammaproteobacteria bacterium]
MDKAQYKSGQRKDWDSVSLGWRKWWQTIEQGAQAVSDEMLDLALVKQGDSILDVATGIGEPAVSAAKRVGENGQVIATDLSPQMLAIAQERAGNLGLENIQFREADAEVLDVGKTDFDAVLCRWGLMFMPEPLTALKNMHRVLNKGGRLAAAVWSTPPTVPMLSISMGVVGRELKLTPPPPDAPGIFSMANTEKLETLFSAAGFNDISIKTVSANMSFPSSRDYVGFLQEVASPIVSLLSGETEERRNEIWQMIEQASGEYTNKAGQMVTENEAICIVGTA